MLTENDRRHALWLRIAACVLILAASKWGAHRVQSHLDRGCVHGLSTPCALSGRGR